MVRGRRLPESVYNEFAMNGYVVNSDNIKIYIPVKSSLVERFMNSLSLDYNLTT